MRQYSFPNELNYLRLAGLKNPRNRFFSFADLIYLSDDSGSRCILSKRSCLDYLRHEVKPENLLNLSI